MRKQRTLFMIGRTRVHVDRMENLGEWLELEVVLEKDEPSTVGSSEVQELMVKLGIDSAQLVEGAYLDLLSGS